MITSRSAALDRLTRLEVLRDPNRGRAIAAFHDAGMSLREIAEALNCSEPVLNMLLLELIRSVRRIDSPSLDRALGYIPHRRQGIRFYPPRQNAAGVALDEELAVPLGREILDWLRSATLTAADRLEIIQHAESRLDQTPLNALGQFAFSTEWAIEEVLSLWKPKGALNTRASLNREIGRWLASWIHFWISSPQVWSKALDLVSAALEQEIQPQTA